LTKGQHINLFYLFGIEKDSVKKESLEYKIIKKGGFSFFLPVEVSILLNGKKRKKDLVGKRTCF